MKRKEKRKERRNKGREEGKEGLLVEMGFLFGAYKVLELAVMIVQCHQGTK